MDTKCALLKAAHKEGQGRRAAREEDANFVPINVEQQLAATGAAPPSIHLARCGFGGLGGGFSGGGFSIGNFSGGVFSCGDAPPAVAVVSGFAVPAAAPSAHAEAFGHACMASGNDLLLASRPALLAAWIHFSLQPYRVINAFEGQK